MRSPIFTNATVRFAEKHLALQAYLYCSEAAAIFTGSLAKRISSCFELHQVIGQSSARSAEATFPILIRIGVRTGYPLAY